MLSLLTFWLALLTGAPQPSPTPPAFPVDWTGDWRGTLHVIRGQDTALTTTIRISIAALDSGRYSYQLGYGEDGGDERPYVLMPTGEPNHWRIDEANGIVLDSYVHAGVLYSAFEVAGNLLFTRDELRGDTLYHEIVSGPLRAAQATGDTVLLSGDTIPPVRSLALTSVQVARMVRL